MLGIYRTKIGQQVGWIYDKTMNIRWISASTIFIDLRTELL